MRAALPDAALDQLFRAARTPNAFLPEPVSEAQIEALWELLKFGPTSANQLPARFVWVTSTAARERLAECVSEGNKPKVRSAPVSVIVGMDLDFHEHLPELFPHADARSWFAGNDALIESSAFRNSTLQGAYLIMAARALGLDAGPMSGFDQAAVDAAFFPEGRVRTNFISTLGVGDPASVFPRSPRPPFERFNRIV